MNSARKILGLLCSLLIVSCSPKYTITDSGVVIEDGANRLAITPNSERSVRVQYYNSDMVLSDTSYIFTERFETPQFSVGASLGAIRVSLPELRVVYRGDVLRFYNSAGELLLKEKSGSRLLEQSSIRGESTYKIEQAFHSPKDERIYGTGQFQDGFLDVRDLPRRLTQVNTQISLPHIYSSKGYSLLWHNYGLTDFNPADNAVRLKAGVSGDAKLVKVTTADGEEVEERRDGSFEGLLNVDADGTYNLMLDVGQVMGRKHYVEIDGQAVVNMTNTWLPPTTSWRMALTAGEHSVKVVGEAMDNPVIYYRAAQDQTLLRSPVAEAIDYTIIAGSADQAISVYRDLSGRAPLMPKWAFGFIHCRERYTTQEQLLRNANEFRQREIPIDMIVQDWNYWDSRGNGWNSLEFDLRRYPTPEQMVDSVHRMNMRLMTSVWPRMRLAPVHKAYDDLHDKFLPGSMFLDLFSPQTQELFGENIYNQMGVMGIDGWWLDGTEPQDDGLLGVDTYLGAGEKVRIAYPLFVNAAVYNSLRTNDPNKRPFLFTRSAFLGQQRYGATSWSGDVGNNWETLKRQIHAGLNFSIAGIPYWTFDAGGFFRPSGQYEDEAFHQRFIRWLQFATFAPLQRVHGFMTKTEIWRFGDFVLSESVKLINLRYRFLPYIYSEAARVTYDNGTLMRPLVMDFADDPKALDCAYQYMFGPNLLVAPVVAPDVESWEVYLPKHQGGWIDFWNGQRYEGGVTINRDVTISEVPLFVKAGSIIPMGELQQYSSQKQNPTLNIRIYEGDNAEYLLYEDEGDNNNYEKGKFSKIKIHWDDKSKTLTLGERTGSYDGMPEQRTFRLTLMRSERGAGLGEDEYFDAEIEYSGWSVEYQF